MRAVDIVDIRLNFLNGVSPSVVHHVVAANAGDYVIRGPVAQSITYVNTEGAFLTGARSKESEGQCGDEFLHFDFGVRGSG